MNRTTSRIAATVTALFWMGWIALSGTSAATLDIQKKAKAAGIAADNCQYCHVDKLPKKEAHENNDRGKWLVAEKDKRKAKEVDPAWLKDYKGK
jgi:gluconate kinase